MVVQVCFPMHLYGKKHLKILFSKIEDALWLNLCIYYWEHLHVCSGYVTQVSEQWPVGLLFTYSGTVVTYLLSSHLNLLCKHTYSNILKILQPKKKESFQIKKSVIFYISAQNIDCGYSLEPTLEGGLNKYPQSMFFYKIRKK